MADQIKLGLAKPHEEAIGFIRGKPAVARAVFDRLIPELRARAFTVTGIEEFDRLQRIRDAISGLPAGSTWDETKAEVITQLDALGENADRRAELLLRTHGFQAFQAANWNVAQADADTTHLQYLATEDDRVRDTHLALNGLIVPKDDAFWQRHYPPWEWGCRCRVRPINPDLLQEARDRDAGVAPDNRFVMEGPMLQRLRDGQLIRDGRAYDVSSPADRPGGDKAFQWSPGDLHLDAARLAERYDPETWSEWKDWAQTTEIVSGQTVWDWVSTRSLPSPDLPRPVSPGRPITSDPSPPGLGNAARDRLIASGFDTAMAEEILKTPAVVASHLDGVAFEASSGGAFYRPSTRTIAWNPDPTKWGGQPMSLHHEYGHHLHMATGLITETSAAPEIVEAVKKDFAAWKRWAKAITEDWTSVFKRGAYSSVARSAFAQALGVVDGNFATDRTGAKRIGRAMDTVLAISKGRYGEGHALRYIKQGNHGLMEAFAHGYSAIVDGDSAFQRMFPRLSATLKKALGL